MSAKTVFYYIKSKYRLLVDKRYTTIAGTLVYFLVMSIMPVAVWLTIFLGKMKLPVEEILEMPVFDSVKSVLIYIRAEAMKQQKSASVFLIITALYSSTSLFYHMRRSGEIIYGYHRSKSGIKIRISAVALLFAVMFLTIISIGIVAGGSYFTAKIFSPWLSTTLDYLLLIAVSFGLVLTLNFYICPYRVKVKELLAGTAATVVAWAVALVGFAIYLKIGNTGELYGALSTIIVFMLWLYVLMICFVSGVIINSSKITAREEKTL